jgi:hypothetical protein
MNHCPLCTAFCDITTNICREMHVRLMKRNWCECGRQQKGNAVCDCIQVSLPSLSVTHFKYFHIATASGGPGPPHYRVFTITLIQHTRYDSSGRVISPKQRSLHDNVQNPQDTFIHASGGNRTRSPYKRVAADPCLRLRSQ